MSIFNIPEHKNCTNCGACCGIVPATIPEINAIRDYIAVNGIQPIKHKEFGICPFRDDDAKKCLIYPVRPTVCRLMGVTSGMRCPNGNTAEIDGKKFLPKPEDIFGENRKVEVLNFVRW